MPDPTPPATLKFRKPTRCTKIQMFSIARVDRTRTPNRCSRKGLYHVWIWKSFDAEPDLAHPPKGLKCQCGLLEE